MRKRRHDAAPNAEWVLMYRKGLSGQRVADLVGRPVRTVEYHLRLARADDPGLQQDHDEAVGMHPAGVAAMDALIRFVRENGTFPTAGAADPEVRKLGRWLYYRRRESRLGTLHDGYRAGLAVLPGWDAPGPKRGREDAQWSRKLEGLAAYLQTGNDWPRNGTGEGEEERAHGRWLGTQRHLRSTGKLIPSRAQILDERLPGWVQGRQGGTRTRSKAGAGGQSHGLTQPRSLSVH